MWFTIRSFFRPRWSDKQVEQLLFLLNLVEEHGFLDRIASPETRLEQVELATWFKKSYELHRARELVNQRYEGKRDNGC